MFVAFSTFLPSTCASFLIFPTFFFRVEKEKVEMLKQGWGGGKNNFYGGNSLKFMNSIVRVLYSSSFITLHVSLCEFSFPSSFFISMLVVEN